MALARTFLKLRKTRRLPMTAWESEGIPSAYINDVEKKGLLPGQDKMDDIVKVFVKVAKEQGAADPKTDAHRLWRDRDQQVFVDRVGMDSQVAEVLVELRAMMRETGLSHRRRRKLLETMRYTAEQLGGLGGTQQDEFLERLRRTARDFSVDVSGAG
jgi:hypothetical protein